VVASVERRVLRKQGRDKPRREGGNEHFFQGTNLAEGGGGGDRQKVETELGDKMVKGGWKGS